MPTITLPRPANLTLRQLIILLFYAGVFTVSFDLVLVANLGFNFRFSQLAWCLPIVAAITLSVVHRRLKRPLGFISLWLWFVVIVAFIPNTTFPMRSVGYSFWLAYSIALIYTTCYLFDSVPSLVSLLRCYLNSFLFVTGFGLFQFLAPLVGLPAPLVEQWWFRGRIARINGFSYEPSYFATYILMGWVLSAYLLATKSQLFRTNYVRLVFWLTGAALVLSSSRMAWIMMLLWFAQYPLRLVMRLMSGRLNLSLFKRSATLAAVALAGAVVVVFVVGVDQILFLFRGIGIAGQSSHSSGARTRQFMDTLQIFFNSPLVGYSLGGISVAIGKMRGIAVTNLDIAKSHEGMSVFAEVLAASGLIGVLPFVWYLGRLFISPFRRAALLIDSEIALVLKGLVVSLGFELAILQFNQNILRPYVWLHIAILSAAFGVAMRLPTKPSATDRQETADNPMV